MDEREKMMLERIKPERHISAMMTLETIKYIKEECRKNKKCECCRFHKAKNVDWDTCYFCGADVNPMDWNEYDLTERIYK